MTPVFQEFFLFLVPATGPLHLCPLDPEGSLRDPGTAAPETSPATQKMLPHHVPRCPAFSFAKSSCGSAGLPVSSSQRSALRGQAPAPCFSPARPEPDE